MDPRWKAFIQRMDNASREDPVGPPESSDPVLVWVGWLVGGLVMVLVVLGGVFAAVRKGLLQLGGCLEAAGGFFRRLARAPAEDSQPTADAPQPTGRPTGVGPPGTNGRSDDSLEMRLASNERENRRQGVVRWSTMPRSRSECV